ncbi:hypothetical protein WP50_35030, partial [Lactiplantibacillus plantarum]
YRDENGEFTSRPQLKKVPRLGPKAYEQAVGFLRIIDGKNVVGVNLNTASSELLTHISGLSSTIAQNVITYRDENGEFTSRPQLKKVPRLGPKAYEQAVCCG